MDTVPYGSPCPSMPSRSQKRRVELHDRSPGYEPGGMLLPYTAVKKMPWRDRFSQVHSDGVAIASSISPNPSSLGANTKIPIIQASS